MNAIMFLVQVLVTLTFYGLGIYALVLLIQALKIYIKKNS